MLKQVALKLTLPVTLALFALASFYPVESMWGLNHLLFLPGIIKYLFGLFVLISLYLLFGPIPEKLIERTVNKINDAFWGEDILPRLLLVTVCTALFFIFRVQTHLLGDGYTWLAAF